MPRRCVSGVAGLLSTFLLRSLRPPVLLFCWLAIVFVWLFGSGGVDLCVLVLVLVLGRV